MASAVATERLPEAALRAEIRLLGQLLGETLRQHEGRELYDLEESIRLRTKALRQEFRAAEEAALLADLDRIPVHDAARLVRAFATYFQLVNLAELERQARAVAAAGSEPGAIEASIARCAELGVSAAAAMPVFAGGGPAAGGAAAPAEEKTEFTVTLTEIGTNKINVIKVVREITSLGLKEAKDLVEGAPKPIKEAIPKDEANAIKKKFEDVGAKVEIK